MGDAQPDTPAPGDGRLFAELSPTDALGLAKVMQALSLACDVEGVGAVVRARAPDLLEADAASLVVREGELCRFVEATGLDPRWQGASVPLDRCVSGWSIRRGEGVACLDVSGDPRVPPNLLAGTGVCSLAIAPVRCEEPIAAIGVYWKKPHRPSARDLLLLQSMADAAAVALVNARLLGVLRQAEERSRLALQAAETGTWDLDVDSGELYWDEGCRQLFGMPPDTPVDAELFMPAVHPDDRAKVLSSFVDAFEAGPNAEYRCEYRTVGGLDGRVRHVVARGRVSRGRGGEPTRLLGTVLDVTELKRMQSDLERSIRAREDFLAIAGHELKTPLSALQLQVQSVRKLLDGDRSPEVLERVVQRLDRTLTHIERLGRLVDELLDVSRISSGNLHLEPDWFSLAELVRELENRYAETAARAGSALTVHVDDPVCGRWDRLRIEQVVSNLLSNALKYGAGKPVRVRLGREGEWAVLEVRDEGIGISSEVRPRLFRRFERGVSDAHYAGLGLGLWISNEIVTSSGGRIDVESAPGQGATFRVLLPLVDPSAAG